MDITIYDVSKFSTKEELLVIQSDQQGTIFSHANYFIKSTMLHHEDVAIPTGYRFIYFEVFVNAAILCACPPLNVTALLFIISNKFIMGITIYGEDLYAFIQNCCVVNCNIDLQLIAMALRHHFYLTHCGLVKPYGDINMGQHWLHGLMAPSHYLNQCWLIISKVQWHQPSVTEISLKITYLKFCSNLPRANELKHWQCNSKLAMISILLLWSTYWPTS